MLRCAISLLAAAPLLLATPAMAALPHYHAVPAEKPGKAKLILRDIVWTCGESQCAAGKSSSRAVVVCAILAREVGRIQAFTVDGRALGAEELEKCNARAT